MRWKQHDAPVPLPVQALDHATGYLMAAAVLAGLRQRLQHGCGNQTRLSLARTAWLLEQHRYGLNEQQTGITPRLCDNQPCTELTSWGIGVRLRSAAWLPGTALQCATPGNPPGSHPAHW